MSFAVIGAGNTGQAIVGYLSLQGKKVKLYSRSPVKAEILSFQGLELKGVYTGRVPIQVSSQMEEVIDDVEYIIITSTASGHKSIFKQLKPHLKKNQTIAIFPGYWGAIECKAVLGDDIEEKNLTIAETSAMPFISKADSTGSVTISRIKQNVQISVIPTSKNLTISKYFLETFPQLILANNVIETSLNNSNVVVHTPITLFNASRIDSASEFRFYGDGTSPLTVSYVEKLDEERIKLAEHLNIKTQSILSILNEFYKTDYPSLYEALPGLFPDGLAPTTLDYRYVTEDIPYGLVPISELSRKVGLETPYTDSLINTASLLMERDFKAEGISFEGFTVEDINHLRGLTPYI
ncbi:NAD/NADP-dependent octopine/nopaline dehydrogenase family protein [Fredinandcohnia sp. FSL W7-1320]|uniref:NAD/NADP-dependent octopine/nopaline dehydrogenase family protein n=1 Tax=Fredinandcohnia sp. FSL W7-1320 TaxID=2954540 RepID=UPI0030FD8EF8